MALCLSAGAALAVLAMNSFTLAWTHSIEKIRWEEDWQADWRLPQGRLQLVAARVRGTGAGMEPAHDAILRDGVWHYRPHLAPLDELLLAHSPVVKAYEICTAAGCRPLPDYLPNLPAQATLRLVACP